MSHSVRHSFSIALIVAGAFFMENLDGTVIAIALPRMAESFHAGPISLNIGMTAYMLLMYGLELFGEQSPPWHMIVLLLTGSFLAGLLMVWHSTRDATPLIDLSSLRIRTFAVTIWGGSLFRVAISVIPFLLPLLFQIGFELSAFKSGLLVLAVFAGNLGMKIVTTPVIRLFGFRRVLIGNGLLTALSLFACAFLSPTMPTAVIVAVLFFGGLCRSMQFTSLNTLGFADIPPGQMSAATTFASMVQQMTMGMGVAAGAIALRIAGLLRHGSTSKPTISDFHLAFLLIGLIALASVLDFLKLDAAAGAVVSGHQKS